jgi:hypothetical protein
MYSGWKATLTTPDAEPLVYMETKKDLVVYALNDYFMNEDRPNVTVQWEQIQLEEVPNAQQ